MSQYPLPRIVVLSLLASAVYGVHLRGEQQDNKLPIRCSSCQEHGVTLPMKQGRQFVPQGRDDKGPQQQGRPGAQEGARQAARSPKQPKDHRKDHSPHLDAAEHGLPSRRPDDSHHGPEHRDSEGPEHSAHPEHSEHPDHSSGVPPRRSRQFEGQGREAKGPQLQGRPGAQEGARPAAPSPKQPKDHSPHLDAEHGLPARRPDDSHHGPEHRDSEGPEHSAHAEHSAHPEHSEHPEHSAGVPPRRGRQFEGQGHGDKGHRGHPGAQEGADPAALSPKQLEHDDQEEGAGHPEPNPRT